MNIFLHFILVSVILCEVADSAPIEGNAVKNSTLSLPIPLPKYTKIKDPAHVIVRWDPVTIGEDYPILGFKVKLWEDEKKKIKKIVVKDGQEVGVEEWVPVKKSFQDLPTHKPAFEAVLPPDVFEASFDVKLDEHYELRAQSFNADGDGPLSNSYGFRIFTEEESKLYESTTERSDGKDNVKVTILS